MQASFDDGGPGDSSITCVAGYFLRDEVLAPFREEWHRLLDDRRFHMVDLVHGREDFRDLDRPQLDQLARSLIAAIKKYMTLGIVISVERAAFDECAQEPQDIRSDIGSPYSLCATLCLAYAARWMEQEDILPEETVYFFESGSKNQADANKFLDSISKNPLMDERYRYITHAEVKKNKLPSLDAADLLAWEWTQQCKRIVGQERRPPRASLKSLCEKPHIMAHYNRTNVRVAFAHVFLEPVVVPGAGRDYPIFVKPEHLKLE
jgi:hypothetical protein